MKFLLQVICAALCCLFFAYGTVVKGVGSGSRFWMVWWAGAAFFALLFAALHLGWFTYIPKPLLYAFFAMIGCGLLYVIICCVLIFSHFADGAREAPDVLIVLGAQVHPEGPSIILRHRLDTAAEVMEQYPQTKCIVSGGQGDNEHTPEARVMRDYLIANGVEPSRIRTEETSLNTIGNIRNCLPLIDAEHDRVGIVTNDFHLFRGVAIAKKQGIRNAFGIAAPSRAFYLPHNMLRECVGILKDKLLGNL